MPRKPRTLSASGIYHVTLRGINHQQIFESPEDYRSFLLSLKLTMDRFPCLLHAYCLMGNHVHLLLESHDSPLGDIMKSLEDSFVYHYNKRYHRCGILFQNRYYSVPVQTETHFLATMRYIHQNPMRAGIESAPGTYPWSSYHKYYHDAVGEPPLCTSRIHSLCPDLVSLQSFLSKELSAGETLACRTKAWYNDEQLIRLILELTACNDLTSVRQLPAKERNELIRHLSDHHIPFVAIGRMLCLSPAYVGRLAKS